MAKKRTVILLFFGICVLSCGLLIWALNSPAADDYYWIHKRGTEDELAFAFTIALRTNHPAAYEMIDPGLRPRLDEWMNTHQAQKCTSKANTTLSGSGTKEGFLVAFGCFGDKRAYAIFVDNILIQDMRVADWGEIEEER